MCICNEERCPGNTAQNIYESLKSMTKSIQGFEDLLENFSLSEERRIKLTAVSKISSVQGFLTSPNNPNQVHRIYGWIS